MRRDDFPAVGDANPATCRHTETFVPGIRNTPPNHNVYCSLCGVRLVRGVPVQDPEPEPEPEPVPDPGPCPACDGAPMLLGSLGKTVHFRCRNCGWDWSA